MEFYITGPTDFLEAFAGANRVRHGGAPFSVGRSSGGAGPGPHNTDLLTVIFEDQITEAEAQKWLNHVCENVAESQDMEEELEDVSVERVD